MKLHDTDKQNMLLSPAAWFDAQTPEPWLTEYDQNELCCASFEQLSAFWSPQVRTIALWSWITHKDALCFSGLFVLSFISYSLVKGICIILTLIVGKLESRCLSRVVFVKEFDSCSSVTWYPDCATGFDCWLSGTSKHLELWKMLLVR
jgi:hypothetical protein